MLSDDIRLWRFVPLMDAQTLLRLLVHMADATAVAPMRVTAKAT